MQILLNLLVPALVVLQVAAVPLPGVVPLPVTISSERRPRVDAPSTQVPNAIEGITPIILFNDHDNFKSIVDPGSRFSADMDDTFNGGNSDVIIPYYPTKKYQSKNSEPVKKYKTKSKSQETSEKMINVVEEEFEVSINRVSTSAPEPDTNNTLVIGNETLNDEPDANSTLFQNGTENYAEEVTAGESLELDGKMAVAAATSVEQEVFHSAGLDAGSITGITLGIVVISGLFGSYGFSLKGSSDYHFFTQGPYHLYCTAGGT